MINFIKKKLSITSGNRPICVNHGCNNLVARSNSKNNPIAQYKVHCSRCCQASRGATDHAPGVTPFKVGKCSNSDGHLGFKCVTKLNALPKWKRGTFTEVDHIDGNHTNNKLKNLQELCTVCHKLKGQLNGDFNRHRNKKK